MMKGYKVTFYLTDQQQAQLEKLVERWNAAEALGQTTPERLFENMMTTGSAHDIDQKMSLFEASLKKYE